MHRRAPSALLVVALLCAGGLRTAGAQSPRAQGPPPAPTAVVHGVVLDDRGQPLAGAVVSAFGSATVFAVSDPEGRFAFRKIPYGPYLLRAHLDGYTAARARLINVDTASSTLSAIALTRRPAASGEAPILAAGVAGDEGAPATAGDAGDAHDHGEVSWRLRHLRRGVLKQVGTSVMDAANEALFDESVETLGWALHQPTRFALMLADIPWDGQINLLTSTSFDHVSDLALKPRWPTGTAVVSLEAPTSTGRWAMRGALTQSDLASWMLAASFRRAPADHRYEAGLSYGMQSYLGGHVSPRSAAFEGSRTAGALYAYDEWTLSPVLAVTYGGEYARYDYLPGSGLFSPRLAVAVSPGGLTLRADVSRRAVAPGAEEFLPPNHGVWIPAERTFSALAARRVLSPERVDHAELAAEQVVGTGVHLGARVFRQRVDNQLVTLFGVRPPGTAVPASNHYYVASAGDLDAFGWGVGVNKTIADRLVASIDYTQVAATWRRDSPDAALLALLAASARYAARERFHDITTSVTSTLPRTDTRLLVIYKVNSRLLRHGDASRGGTRFDVQVTQELPFLSVGDATVEMLMAVRSLFREDVFDGSVYDEVLAMRPPKRLMGGITVRF